MFSFPRRWFLVSLFTACLVPISVTESAPPKLRVDPSIRVKVIEVPPNARTERDFQKAERAWAERALIAPFRERAKGKAWEAAAIGFAGRAFDVWPGDFTTPELPGLSREGQDLLAQGCDDPLIGYLTTWARWFSTEEYYASREAFDKWMRAAEKLPRPTGAVLARLCGAEFYKADTVVKLGVGDLPKRLLRVTAAAWRDGGYLPEEDFIFVRQLFTERNTPFFDKHHEDLWATLKPLGLPEWAEATILGRVEIERAWKKRGVKFADSVSQEQWAGFGEHLAEARTHLVKAWELRPDQPIAATGMIRVRMGLGGGEGDNSPRTWFDRAIAGECDYKLAYMQYALALTPRWGGSFGHMVKLAEECAATGRFDTEVPRRAISVLHRAYEEAEDYWVLYRRPEIAPIVLSVFRGYANEQNRTATRKRDLADLAVYAHAAGDAAVSAKALAEYGTEPLPRSARVFLNDLGIDEAILRGDVALLSGPMSQEFVTAEKARAERKYTDARTGYEALLSHAKGAGASRLRGLLGIVTVEEKLATGEWVTIPVDPDLSGWIQRSGTWFSTPEGMPAIREADGPVRIVYGARIGGRFEVRATLKNEGEPKARWFQGLVVGDERVKRFKARWHGAFVRFDKGRQVGTGRCFFREFVTGLPGVDCPFGETNEFTLRMADKKLSWTVNGKPIHQNAPLNDFGEETHIGFGSFKHTNGVTIALQKLEVRKVPGE